MSTPGAHGSRTAGPSVDIILKARIGIVLQASAAELLLRQARYENRAFWRNPESAFFTFAFPLVFMVIINLVFATSGTAGGLLLAAIVALFGAIVFGVELRLGALPELVIVLVFGAASFAALGLAAAGLIPSSQSAPAVVNAIILPLLFISNVFIYIEDGILRTISELFPVRHLADALQAIYHPAWAGPLDPLDLLWVAGWGIAGLVVARRTFTWEPRT